MIRFRDDPMYWTCLFCVEAANQTWLFYGYATPAEGFQPG
jgi:hypothetical protein